MRLDILPFLIIFGVGGVVFAILLIAGARARPGRTSPGPGKAIEIAVAGLASTNLAGVLGLAWFAAAMLVSDGIMVVEHGICAALIVVVAMITAGAFALKRRGKTMSAVVLLAVAALPTIAAYGFLLYLGTHPIDMR